MTLSIITLTIKRL